MNFANAAMCIALAFVLTDVAKRAWPGQLPAIVVQGLALAIGIGTIFLAGSTVWAHSQVIGGHTLDTLNAGSKIVAGLFIGGGATLVDRFTLFSSRSQDPAPPKA